VKRTILKPPLPTSETSTQDAPRRLTRRASNVNTTRGTSNPPPLSPTRRTTQNTSDFHIAFQPLSANPRLVQPQMSQDEYQRAERAARRYEQRFRQSQNAHENLLAKFQALGLDPAQPVELLQAQLHHASQQQATSPKLAADSSSGDDDSISSLLKTFVKSQARFFTQQESQIRHQVKHLENQSLSQKKLPDFSGQHEPSFEEWRDTLLRLQKAREWTDEQMYRDAMLALGEPARSAVMLHENETVTLNTLLRFLQKRYGIRDPYTYYLGKLSSMGHSEEESGIAYCGRFTQYRRRLDDASRANEQVSDRALRTWFIRGIRDAYATEVERLIEYSKDYVSLSACVKVVHKMDKRIKKHEAKMRTFSSNAVAVQSNEPRTGSVSRVSTAPKRSSRKPANSARSSPAPVTHDNSTECWKWGIPGVNHTSANCPNGTFRFCTFCKKINSHTSRNCWERSP